MLNNGTIVHYNIEGEVRYSGQGIIHGVSSNELPVIGYQYIIEDISGNFPNEKYPYKMFACFASSLTNQC